MKKIVLLFLAATAFCQSVAQENYYWYKNSRQQLVLDKHRLYITVKSLSDADSIKKELNAIGIGFDEFKSVNYGTSFIDSLNVYWSFLYLPDSISEYTNPLIRYSSPSYVLANGKQVGISHMIHVLLTSESDTVILKQLAGNLGAAVLGENNMIPRLYTLSCTNVSTYDALGIANALHATNLFEYAEPDIMGYEFFCVNDTYFSDQWGLNNTGQFSGYSGIDINYCLARQITSGNSNVVVAVVDQGVELNHPDLTNMHPLSYNADLGMSPSSVIGPHGTACAGIIGADADNGIGVAGIAPDCPLMSISVDVTAPNSNPKIASAIRFARNNGASVISNSWGGDVQSNIMDYAIDSAYKYGRNGKGCIMVFAAGNENTSVSYPATNDNVIAVGAISYCGERFSPFSCDGYTGGSNYGYALDVMAPGALIATTDRVGIKGYNNGQVSYIPIQIGMPAIFEYNNLDYTLAFGKTSAACPHVAGVAALMLSVNPNLTAAQVARIIKGTAQKVGNYNYGYCPNHLNGSWHEEMGHGLVDAAAAVSAAQSSTHDWYIRDNSSDTGNEPYYTTDAVNLSPDIKLYTLDGQEETVPKGGVTYNVKVTVHNNSNSYISLSPSSVSVHWLAKNSNPFWKSSWTSAGSQCNVPLSGSFSFTSGSFLMPMIAPGNSTTLSHQWTAPIIGPPNCIASYYTTPLHLVATVDDGFLTIGKDDTQFPLEQYVKTNNNVAWRQYTLVYDPVLPPLITSINPNPSNGQTTVSYRLGEGIDNAVLVVTTVTGNTVATLPISGNEDSVELDLRSSTKGQYIVQLVVSSEVLDAKQFVVE